MVEASPEKIVVGTSRGRKGQFGESLDDFARYDASRSSSHQFDLEFRPNGGAEYPSTKIDNIAERTPIRGHEADIAAILTNTPIMLARCSRDLRYLFVSEAASRMFGLRPEDFEGRLIIDILGEEAFRTISPYVEKVLRGEPVEYETDIHYSGVGPRRVLAKYTPDRDSAGNVQGWVATIVDLTNQRKADAQIAADLQAMTILKEMGSLYVRNDLQTDECLHHTIDAAITLVGADKGNIRVYNSSSNSLVMAAHRGFAEPFLTFFKHVRDDGSTCAAATRTKGQVIVEDVLESDIFVGHKSLAVLIDAGVRAVISTPLLSSNGNLMGMIATHYSNPHRPTDREVYLIQVLARQAADYLERRRAEQTEKTLLRELNHRCNNLLAVVQAIANKSLSDDHTLAEARTAFVARLQALARANRHITKFDWSGVELHELVQTELEPFKANVTVEGGPVKVHPQDAQNLSLALHELVTNAAKYGALSSVVGRVRVSWRIIRGNNRTLHFRWQELGGPRVVAPNRQGFGTTLLKGMFTNIRLDYLEEGLDCEFDLQL
jgi:PAS domain S-box-containing protein